MTTLLVFIASHHEAIADNVAFYGVRLIAGI